MSLAEGLALGGTAYLAVGVVVIATLVRRYGGTDRPSALACLAGAVVWLPALVIILLLGKAKVR